MKKITALEIFLVCLSLGIPKVSEAQMIDTTLTAFFPLHVGDYWEYEYINFIFPDKRCRRIIGENLINGKKYFAIQEVSTTYGFLGPTTLMGHFRINDSMMVVGRNTSGFAGGDTTTEGDEIIYKLNEPVGSRWVVYRWPSTTEYRKVSSVSDSTLHYVPEFEGGYGQPTDTDNSAFLEKHKGLVFAGYGMGLGIVLKGSIINGVRSGTITDSLYNVLSVEQTNAAPARAFVVSQNYPNPFNPSTTIAYQLTAAGQVRLKVFDLVGREVATLVDARQNAGSYRVQFNANKLSSGVYFYRLQANGKIETKHMTLLK
ncbi:MAG: T9SS type A sorting domain-containing protein [Rhizobacter sp.]|nr:T9SS type A sorting domain-containing protein [Chlorobiales bacterium]